MTEEFYICDYPTLEYLLNQDDVSYDKHGQGYYKDVKLHVDSAMTGIQKLDRETLPHPRPKETLNKVKVVNEDGVIKASVKIGEEEYTYEDRLDGNIEAINRETRTEMMNHLMENVRTHLAEKARESYFLKKNIGDMG